MYQFSGTRDQIQSPSCERQLLYHWATPSAFQRCPENETWTNDTQTLDCLHHGQALIKGLKKADVCFLCPFPLFFVLFFFLFLLFHILAVEWDGRRAPGNGSVGKSTCCISTRARGLCGAYAGVTVQELEKARPGILVEVSSLNLEFSVLAFGLCLSSAGIKDMCTTPHSILLYKNPSSGSCWKIWHRIISKIIYSTSNVNE